MLVKVKVYKHIDFILYLSIYSYIKSLDTSHSQRTYITFQFENMR